MRASRARMVLDYPLPVCREVSKVRQRLPRWPSPDWIADRPAEKPAVRTGSSQTALGRPRRANSLASARTSGSISEFARCERLNRAAQAASARATDAGSARRRAARVGISICGPKDTRQEREYPSQLAHTAGAVGWAALKPPVASDRTWPPAADDCDGATPGAGSASVNLATATAAATGLALALGLRHCGSNGSTTPVAREPTRCQQRNYPLTDVRRPEEQILRTRIRFALRRATGVVFDIDAMLRKPEFRERRIRLWRDVGSDELSSLLDQLETEFQADSAAADADSSIGGHPQ